MKKCLSRSTMHSKVDTESSPTASPNTSASRSIAVKVARSCFNTRVSCTCPLASDCSMALFNDSTVTETSNSFCSCICKEQSRPPMDIHHWPLPITCISWWRVVSMFSSTKTFLLSPTPVVLTSLRISLTNSAVRADSPTPRMRWPLPPPPPIAFSRTRLLG